MTEVNGQKSEVSKNVALSAMLLALSFFSSMLFALCAPAQAQQPKKVPLIGFLSARDPAAESARAAAIRLALRELGYIEGQNIATEHQYAEGKVDRASELVAELVRLKVDIIVVGGRRVLLLAAKNATKRIPVVMIGAGVDQFKESFVESLARPCGNVTAITELSPELTGKRLELLKETFYGMIRKARFRCIL